MRNHVGPALVAVLASSLFAACDRSASSSDIVGVVHSALSTPTLASRSGLLCVTTGDYTPPPPARWDGWLDTTVPQIRAVLGGSGIGMGGVIADSQLSFQVTALSDSAAWGDHREVCAEISAASPCGTVLACWRGDGQGTIEATNDASCDPAVPPNRVVYATTASLPALTAGASTYRIEVMWSLQDGHSVSATFFKDGALVGSAVTSGIGTFTTSGFGGFRTNRVQVHARLTSRTPTAGVWVSPTAAARVGQVLTDGTKLGCSYQAPPPAGLFASVNPIWAPTASWLPPTGATPAEYRVYFDGHELFRTPTLSYAHTIYDNLVAHRFHVQVAYADAGGVLSEAGDALGTAFPAPLAAAFADQSLSLGVVLLRYQDSAVPVESWGGRKNAISNKVFGTTAGAYTFRNYIHESSAGRADVTGSMSDWILLRQPPDLVNGTPLSLSTDCSSTTSGDPYLWQGCRFGLAPGVDQVEGLKAQARAAGFPVDSFERVIFYVSGIGSANSSLIMGAVGRFMTDPDGLPRLSFVSHEVGHTFGFGHTYGGYCPAANLVTVGDAVCGATGGSRASTGMGTPFDAQVSSYYHMSRWNSLYQYEQGWLHEDEVIHHDAGLADATYALAPLDATGATGARQLRVEIDGGAFYFAEYRDGTGFDAPGPWDNAAGVVGTALANYQVYRDPKGVAVWLRPPRSGEPNFQMPLSVASSLNAGGYYCDPIRQLTLRVVSVSPSAASVRVERGPCTAPPLDPVCPIDELKDGSETGIDCGGPCAKCQNNHQCSSGADCVSGYCGPAATCLAATCTNGAKDGSETDVNCGGPGCTPCVNGKKCKVDQDCQSGHCTASFGMLCATP